MKLSKLTTDKALDVLCQLAPHIASIAADEKVMGTIGKTIDTAGMTRAGVLLAGAEKLTTIVPILLKAHRADVYGVISAVNNVDPEKVAAQNVMVTMAQIREILQDKELLDFFKSFGQQGKNE